MAFDGNNFQADIAVKNKAHNEIMRFDSSGHSQLALPQNFDARASELTRDGMDLQLTSPEGQSVLVEGYFAQDIAPNLTGANGTLLTPKLVNSFVTNGQDYASNPMMSDESPVGLINELSGQATVTRVDGSINHVSIGTEIYQGDIVETSDAGAVNIVFIDETNFAVSEGARLSIDEFVFDPATESGQTDFSVLKGLFVYTSGLIGRDDPDDVLIDTPVGSIGIRGTIIAGNVDNGEVTVVEGAIVLRDFDGNEVTLADQFATARFSAEGRGIEPMGQLNAADVANRFSAVSDVSPTLFSSIEDAAIEGQNENTEEGQQDNNGEEAVQDDANEDGQDTVEAEGESESSDEKQTEEADSKDAEGEKAEDAKEDNSEKGDKAEGKGENSEANEAQNENGDQAEASNEAQVEVVAEVAVEAQSVDVQVAEASASKSSNASSKSQGNKGNNGNNGKGNSKSISALETNTFLYEEDDNAKDEIQEIEIENDAPEIRSAKALAPDEYFTFIENQANTLNGSVQTFTYHFDQVFYDDGGHNNLTYELSEETIQTLNDLLETDDTNIGTLDLYDQENGGSDLPGWEFDAETGLLTLYVNEYFDVDSLDFDVTVYAIDEQGEYSDPYTVTYTALAADDITANTVATDDVNLGNIYNLDDSAEVYYLEYGNIKDVSDNFAGQNITIMLDNNLSDAIVFTEDVASDPSLSKTEMLMAYVNANDYGPTGDDPTQPMLIVGDKDVSYASIFTDNEVHLGAGHQSILLGEQAMNNTVIGGNGANDYNMYFVQNADNNIYAMDGDDIVFMDLSILSYNGNTLHNGDITDPDYIIDGGHSNTSLGQKLTSVEFGSEEYEDLNPAEYSEDLGDVLYLYNGNSSGEALDFSAVDTEFTNFETIILNSVNGGDSNTDNDLTIALNVDDVISMTDIQNTLMITSQEGDNKLMLEGFNIVDLNEDGEINENDVYTWEETIYDADNNAIGTETQSYYLYEGTNANDKTATLLVDANNLEVVTA